MRSAHLPGTHERDGYLRSLENGHRAILLRFTKAARVEINDFGATPELYLATRTAAELAEERMNPIWIIEPMTAERRRRVLSRISIIESPCPRARTGHFDRGTFRELLGPFDRLESPRLPPCCGVVPESDDGVVVVAASSTASEALVMAIEGAFQGGSMGEIRQTEAASALMLARRDCEAGSQFLAVLLLETGA